VKEQLEVSLQATIAERDQAQAAARVINDERRLMKVEWTEMFSSYDSLRSEIQSLREQLTATQSSVQVQTAFAVKCCEASHLPTHSSVNRVHLMCSPHSMYLVKTGTLCGVTCASLLSIFKCEGLRGCCAVERRRGQQASPHAWERASRQ
jgi:hypothetical protein